VPPAQLSLLVHDAGRRLATAGIPPDEARLDAELLMRRVLGWDRATLLVYGREEFPPGLLPDFEQLLSRRERREPMAYILGHAEFWGLDFQLTPAVLIPRPETEQIVEEAVARHAGGAPPDHIADIGTGSGCLAVALACEFPHARVTATDVSREALEVAEANARRHGVVHRVRFVEGSLLAGHPGPFDLVVSNPPYVKAGDRATLAPEVRDHEPGVALFAGDDGLDVVRAIVDTAAAATRSGGWLMVEFGFGQAADVEALTGGHAAWGEIELLDDLQGIPRTLVARRR